MAKKDYHSETRDAIEELKIMIQNLIALPEEANMEDKIEQTLEDLKELRDKVENHTKGYRENKNSES